MKKITPLFIVLSVVFLFNSCNKYSEGPSFSLLTRKNRLCNDWELYSYTINGSEEIQNNTVVKLSIEKDGTYSKAEITENLGQLASTHEYGVWEFKDNKGIVSMTKDTLQIPVDWEIKELKSKYLTLERNLSNNKYVMRYRVN